MDNTEKSTGWKIPQEKTCGKTATEIGRQHWDGLFVAVSIRGWMRLAGDGDILR